MKQLLSLALASLVLVSAQSFAEPGKRIPRDPGVNQRQEMQGQRIHQGVRSGSLTGQETRGLMQERRGIRQEERQFKSDGKLTKGERKDLHQDLNDLSKDIYQQKHDGEVRTKP